MSKMTRIQELFSEYVQLYQFFFGPKDLKRVIYDLNNGMCYSVASSVGQVLANEGYAVQFHSHCHHAWISIDGVDYDSMYPEGYSEPVPKAWLLDEMKLNEEIMTHDFAPGHKLSFTGRHPGVVYFEMAWAARHNLEFTQDYRSYLCPSALKKGRRNYGKEFRKTQRYYRKALKLQYHHRPLPMGLVYPPTHYRYDSVEPNFDRQLKPYPFTRSPATYKFLWKDFRENGTPIACM